MCNPRSTAGQASLHGLGLCLLLVGAGCASAITDGNTAASRKNLINWRETFRETKGHEVTVGAFPHRKIGVNERRGLAFFGQNDVATLAQWSTFEVAGTNTTYSGYALYSFDDNSSIVALVEGSGSLQGQQSGFVTFVRGSGRFSGIQGEAHFTANTVSPVEAGSDTYADFRGEYELLRTLPPEQPANPAR